MRLVAHVRTLARPVLLRTWLDDSLCYVTGFNFLTGSVIHFFGKVFHLGIRAKKLLLQFHLFFPQSRPRALSQLERHYPFRHL